MASDERKLEVRPRVVFRRVQLERVGGENRLSVLCARQLQLIDVADCRECEHCHGLSISGDSRELFLRCAATSSDGPPQAELGMKPALLSEIMSVPVVTMRRDDELGTLLALFDKHGISAAPVADERGRAVGIVTKTDVIRCLQERQECAASIERGRAPLVREIMSHVVFTLTEDAGIVGAAALMAYEGVHHLVITSSDGGIAGIVSSLDILRWLARHGGYVLPERH